jgi:N-acyl-phosphatidylethanolamine-hydrolysing phospholipase D
MVITRRRFLQFFWIVAWATCALAGPPAFSAEAQNAAAAPRFTVTWLGGPTMAITFGNFTILTDPTLGQSFAMGDPNDAVDHQTIRVHQRLAPLTGALDLKAVDLVLLSHAHNDHLDQQAWTDLDHALPIVLPIADMKAVGAKGFRKLDGLKWGETRQFDAGTGLVRITATPAHHSRDPAIAKALGIGNGYWIEFSAGAWKRTIYWTGDTMPTEDVVNTVKSRGELNLMVPHVGGVGTTGPFGQISMGAADVIELAAASRPEYVLPIHHSTYAFYREPISKLVERSKGKPFRLDLISAGSTAVYQ